MLREMIVYSVHGWRHFLVCNTHIAFRLLRRGKKHEIACTSWSSCLWKLCSVKHWRTALHRFYEEEGAYIFLNETSAEEGAYIFWMKQVPVSRNLKVIKKMCTFEVHLCMMFGQLILSGKPFNTFSMARLTRSDMD